MAAIYRFDEVCPTSACGADGVGEDDAVRFDAALLAGSSCAFGVFDGVHEGHRYIIARAVAAARKAGARALIMTFDIDPDELFGRHDVKKLMGNEQRINALAALDVDGVVVVPFTRAFAALEPEAFLDCALGGHVPASIHIGCDFRFGSRARGTVEDLRRWGAKRAMTVDACELLSSDGAPITATRIRGLLAQGAIREANALLGHPYSVVGEVKRGRGEGRDMGFCTANLHIAQSQRALAEGVYAAYVQIGGETYKAAVSVGISPTFSESAQANVEVHVLDFSGDLYGRCIEVRFVHWLRPMMTFSSTEELISTVMGNIAWVRDNL